MIATKGIMDHVFMATCEWFLIFWMFVEAAIAYSLTKFAKYCQLQIPCLLCSRPDRFFGNKKHGSYDDLFCNKHRIDVSFLIYCNLHDELVDARDMCEDCSNSANLQTMSNLECYRYPTSYANKNCVCDNCSCCKSQWKEKSTNQQPIWSNVIGSRGSKATAKPPLPRVGRHGRSKRLKNKVKHRYRNELSPVGQYSGVKFSSDSEFDFIYSDSDDGGFKVMGINERSLKNDTNGVNSYKIFGRHSHSTPDLTSAFLREAQLNESSRTRTRTRTRAASLTPSCLISYNLAEFNKKPEEFDPLRIGNNKNRLSSTNHRTDGSSDGSMLSSNNSGSQNKYNIFSRNSFSASDLRSSIQLEMLNNNTSRQRSASLTPNIIFDNGFGEHQWLIKAPPKVKKHKKTNAYGYLDDSAVSRNTGNHHNRNKVPRRHSYSVFQLGGEILLNMPTDESQNGSFGGGLEDYNNSMLFLQNDDQDFIPLPPYSLIRGYGSLDDSAVTRNSRIQYQNTAPRRHSHTFFNIGDEILLNMPGNESFTNISSSFAPRGSNDYDLEQQTNLKFQKRPNASADFVQKPRRKNKKNKKLKRACGYESMDDLIVSLDKGVHDRNNDPRRHSYSAFELGFALPSNVQSFDKSLTNRSPSVTLNGAINHGFKEPKSSGFKAFDNPSGTTMILNKNHGYGFIDDSVISFNTGVYDKNKDPRRHSYSAFELGCELLNSQPTDKRLTNSPTSVTRNGAIDYDFGEPNNSGFQMGHNPSHSIMFLNKNMGYGFLDDSVVTHNTRTDNHNHHHTHNKIPRRHSYSILQLGGDIILNMPMDEGLTSHSLYLAPNNSPDQSSRDPQKSNFQHIDKDKKSIPPTGSVNRFSPSYDVLSDLSIDKTKWHGSFDDYLILRSMGSQSQSNVPRRHSHSAYDLGRALLLEINLDNSLKNLHASEEHNRAHHHKSKRNKNHLPPLCPTIPSGSSSNFRNDLFTVSLNKAHGVQSLDDSFSSHKIGNHTQNLDSNPRRHSYSAFELGCALLLNMPRNASSTRRSASVTPKIQTVKGSQQLKVKKDEQPLFKPHGYKSDNDFAVSNGKDDRKQWQNLTRNYHSVSDLTSPIILEMNLDESLTRKSASLIPDCIIGQTFEELNKLKFQSGSTSSVQRRKKKVRSKAKRSNRWKAKRIKKQLRKSNNLKLKNPSSPNAASDVSYESFDDSDAYESFDDSDTHESTMDRHNIFSRNSQSASNLGSLAEMDNEDKSRNRSKSLTPDCSYFSNSIDPVLFFDKKGEEKDPIEAAKHNKQLQTNPIKEIDSSSTFKAEYDLRSLDGSIVSDIDYDGGIEKVKRQAEDDVRCMRLLQSELEAERNAATVAANHAMNMITRLQQEKASLQMEALQYLRMMEEQAEYDMEALQKANDLVEEKEIEIQDLLNKLEQYRNKYESMDNIKSFDDEKSYILESISTLEEKINLLWNGVHDHNNETDDEFLKLENEILEMKEKMEALQADVDLVKHACNTLHGNEGLEFIQQIAHQLQDLRRIMFDRSLISSN